MKRYVLTGGPGCGKASILTALECRGEAVIREAARDVILLKRARGIEFPTASPSFEEEALRLHLQRECALARTHLPRVFLDRGVYDYIVYARLLGRSISQNLVKQAHLISYAGAFLIAPLAANCAHSAGPGAQVIPGKQLHEELGRAYTTRGIPLFIVPTSEVDARTKFVTEHADGEKLEHVEQD